MNNAHTMANTNKTKSRNVFDGSLLASGETKLWNPTTKVILLWIAVLICSIGARSFLVN